LKLNELRKCYIKLASKVKMHDDFDEHNILFPLHVKSYLNGEDEASRKANEQLRSAKEFYHLRNNQVFETNVQKIKPDKLVARELLQEAEMQRFIENNQDDPVKLMEITIKNLEKEKALPLPIDKKDKASHFYTMIYLSELIGELIQAEFGNEKQNNFNPENIPALIQKELEYELDALAESVMKCASSDSCAI
jgi:hypothetical protein